LQDEIEFLGLQFANLTLDGAVRKLAQFIEERTPHMVSAPNALCSGSLNMQQTKDTDCIFWVPGKQ